MDKNGFISGLISGPFPWMDSRASSPSPDGKARLIKRGIESHGGYDYQPVEMGLDMDRMG